MPLCSHIVLFESGSTRDASRKIGDAMKNRTSSRAFTLAAIAFAAGFVASAAHAFTVHDSNGQVGGQGYLELDKPAAAPDRMAPVSRFGNENGQTTIKQGNGTFQFGGQRSFDQRYNTDNIFNPYSRDGR
jgi:hypothetical protein